MVALGIRAAHQLLGRMSSESSGIIRDVPFALADQYCRTLVDANLFYSAPDLIGNRFPDSNDLHAFADHVFGEMSPGIQGIAQQLVVDASARTLKQPRSVFRHSRRRTTDLLHEPVT